MNTVSLKPGSKILVVNIGGIGDHIMSIPALNALHELYPDCEISLLTIARGKGLFNAFTFIRKIFYFNIVYQNPLTSLRLSVLKNILKLRKEHFAVAINLEGIFSLTGQWKMKLLFMLINARQWVGRNTNNRGKFYHTSIYENEVDKRHTVQLMLELIYTLGAERKGGIYPQLPVLDEDVLFIESFLQQHTVNHHVLVGINPSSYVPSHRWGSDRFIEIGRRLQNKYNAWIIIHAGPGEKILVEHIAHALGNQCVIAHAFSLNQLAALIKRMKLFITNDTGPMHIAAAVGTPVIALFGPSDVERFGPYTGPGKATIIQKDITCIRPCCRITCDPLRCMEAISVDEVWAAAQRYLDS